MVATNGANDKYMLSTGETASSRLELLNRIFGPDSSEFLNAAGLCPKMRVAEIGCGTGLMALWIAAQTGPQGSVVAVDASPQQLLVAEENARQIPVVNISFHQADAYALHLPHDSFDLVYSRFLMCHLDDLARAITEMGSILKPGGILACEDHDDGGIFTQPPTRAYKRLVEISDALNRTRGLDSSIGLKLPSLLRAAGFPRPEVRVNGLAFLRGEEKCSAVRDLA